MRELGPIASIFAWDCPMTQSVLCRLFSFLSIWALCLQMQELLRGGLQKLEQHPDHQEDVPTRAELTELLGQADKLLQLKEEGNK